MKNNRKAVRERDEAREEAAHWKTEYEIVVARLCGKKHPRDNGIISEHEIIPKLMQERDEARKELQDLLESIRITKDNTNLDDYIPGMGCDCFAKHESECGCEGVDWTPKEVYKLKKERDNSFH